ncbi:unnamed protein product [Sphagnum jensenii]|uniref:Uncharacterized protein n=1 Tax=Sphagnum jensenii TaxID=128206 RepID=A0ABP0VD95_9BRYO
MVDGLFRQIWTEKSKYYEFKHEMQFGIIVKKVDKCISFELFDQNTGDFIISAALRLNAKDSAIMSRQKDAHKREYEELKRIVHKYSSCYLGKTLPSLTGHYHQIIDCAGRKVADVRYQLHIPSAKLHLTQIMFRMGSIVPSLFSSSRPVEFTLRVSADLDQFDTSEFGATEYTAVPPVFNQELRCWQHNLGGAGQVACRNNFVVVRPSMYSTGSTAELCTLKNNEQVCMRHGKVRVMNVLSRSAFNINYRLLIMPILSTFATYRPSLRSLPPALLTRIESSDVLNIKSEILHVVTVQNSEFVTL